MTDDMIEVQLKGLLPTPGGSGVFLESGDKIITIFIDDMVSKALKMVLEGEEMTRPLTHDLLLSVLAGLGVRLTQVVIHDVQDGTYFARLHLVQENELGTSVLEIDSRPSDAMVLATKLRVPLFVRREVWDKAEDMKWAMIQMNPELGDE
jgi:bifunctional DNase/RNase